jgi:hypothetical protein
MKRALRSRSCVRILTGLLVLAFVFPPEAFARVSCAALTALSVPMRCCAMRAAARSSEPRPCCSATDAAHGPNANTIVERATQATSASRAKLVAPDCCCSHRGTGDSLAPTPTPSAHLDVQWIAARADISARAIAFECSPARALCARDAPPSTLPPDCSASEPSSPAAGCARRDLLARGVVGLLTDFGIALL